MHRRLKFGIVSASLLWKFSKFSRFVFRFYCYCFVPPTCRNNSGWSSALSSSICAPRGPRPSNVGGDCRRFMEPQPSARPEFVHGTSSSERVTCKQPPRTKPALADQEVGIAGSTLRRCNNSCSKIDVSQCVIWLSPLGSLEQQFSEFSGVTYSSDMCVPSSSPGS